MVDKNMDVLALSFFQKCQFRIGKSDGWLNKSWTSLLCVATFFKNVVFVSVNSMCFENCWLYQLFVSLFARRAIIKLIKKHECPSYVCHFVQNDVFVSVKSMFSEHCWMYQLCLSCLGRLFPNSFCWFFKNMKVFLVIVFCCLFLCVFCFLWFCNVLCVLLFELL